MTKLVRIAIAAGASGGGGIIRKIKISSLLMAALFIAMFVSLAASAGYGSDPTTDTIYTFAEPSNLTSSLGVASLATVINPQFDGNRTVRLDIETTVTKVRQYLGKNVTAQWIDPYGNTTYWNVLLTRYDQSAAKKLKDTLLYVFLGLSFVTCLTAVVLVRTRGEKPAVPYVSK